MVWRFKHVSTILNERFFEFKMNYVGISEQCLFDTPSEVFTINECKCKIPISVGTIL